MQRLVAALALALTACTADPVATVPPMPSVTPTTSRDCGAGTTFDPAVTICRPAGDRDFGPITFLDVDMVCLGHPGGPAPPAGTRTDRCFQPAPGMRRIESITVGAYVRLQIGPDGVTSIEPYDGPRPI